jgi:hypothetical protein
MKTVRVQDAVGHVLCHDLTCIVKGEYKGARFKKGHIVCEEDIPVLLAMGKEHLFAWELEEGMLHEDEAARQLCAICIGDNMTHNEPSEGKIEITASCNGVFRIDTALLNRINGIDFISIAARHSYSAVRAGEKLAGMRVIPLVISEAVLREAESYAAGKKVFSLQPYVLKTACIVTTGSEVARSLIKDTFTPVVIEKLSEYGISVKRRFISGDAMDDIAGAIASALREQPDMVLCTGGMSVDPDDNTPGAIKQSGARIVSYGAPVLPGAMFLLGYFPDGTAVMGLPGCVMYAKVTVFDMVLPRVAAGIPVTKQDFAVMGNGGFCLSCEVCTYPVCPFGKTA